MTWNPELSDAPFTTVDLDSVISKAANGGSSDMLGRLQHKFKSSDGKTYGNIFPEVAPLIFPQIDELAADQDAEKKLSKMKKKKEFVAKYMDKRAQAKFVSCLDTVPNYSLLTSVCNNRQPKTLTVT